MQIETLVTYLEMKSPPTKCFSQASFSGRKVEIANWNKPNVETYRFLYNTVGAAWTWIERRLLNDNQLLDTITKTNVEIYLIRVDSVVAGFSEIVWSQNHERSEIKYFGLMPEFIGLGLGRYFLSSIINKAWRDSTQRVAVNTCDLDHPKALDLYISCGFEIIKTELENLPDPTQVGLPFPSRGPKR